MAPVLHQALHGYSDGHRLIASSLPLSGVAARVMVAMSDLSGPGVKPEPSGYLTGYPLEGLGKYVFARTWAAPEMSRPGCVWTHSLIIDNADLASLSSVDILLSEFRRPVDPPTRSQYSEPVFAHGPLASSRTISSDRVRDIITALYVAPQNSIVAEADRAEDDEHLVTAIWMQQWPRLRRTFGFCTLAGVDRSAKGVTLDLQFVRSQDRQFRSKFPNAVVPSEIVATPLLESLVSDIEGRDRTQIREFLRRAGGDVDGGRRAMLPLCRLHSSLFAARHPDLPSAVQALESLDSLGTRQARSVRTLVAKNALERIDKVDEAVFDFVIDTLELQGSSNDAAAAVERIGAALWRRSPARFVESIEAGGIIGNASRSALSEITGPELVDGLRGNPQLAERVTTARSDLLERADFWSIPEVNERVVANASPLAAGRVAAALIAAGRGGPASWIVAAAEPGDLAAAMDTASSVPILEPWCKALSQAPSKMAALLSSGQITRRWILACLARAGHPDMASNYDREDPWLSALRSAYKPAEQGDEDYLAAFVMARALGTRSRSQAELFRLSYATVYRAFQYNTLTLDASNMVRMRLDWGWFGGDDCSRLKETVVSRFVDRHLDPETFGRLVDDGDLALALVDEAAQTARGRRYLAEVRRDLQGKSGKGMKARAEYIGRKLK